MPGLVLVTGAAGGIGRSLLSLLRSNGWKTRCLVHRHPVAGADETVPGNLLQPRSLGPAVDGVDAIVHLAAVTHARSAAAYFRANVEGTKALAELGRLAGVRRFVYASSRAASRGGGAYAESKLKAEVVVAESGIEYTILRLAEIYGPGGEQGINRIMAQARARRPILMVGAGHDVVCPLHVDDAAVALAAALQAHAATGKVYTIGGECMSIRTFATRCARAFGVPARLVPLPTAMIAVLSTASRVLPLPLFPDQLARLRVEKEIPGPEAEQDLGFHPRPLEAGLRTGTPASASRT